MSTLLLYPSPRLSLEVEQSDRNGLAFARCRFCDCRDDSPCEIFVREDDLGVFHLANSEQEATLAIACAWFLPNVCNAPACIEKLIAEARNRVVLFDATGRPA